MYSMRNVAKSLVELEEALKRDSKVAPEGEREFLTRLVSETRLLIEGRDEGYLNNIRMLQLMKFLSDLETSTSLMMYDCPDPVRDFSKLVELATTFAERIPKFKEDICC